MHKTKQAWLLLLATPLFLYLTHAIAFFIHEYAQSFSAWLFGFKKNPLLLHYGDYSWSNILFFLNMDENVNYQVFASPHPWKAAFIAFVGLGVGNVLLFLLSVKALLSKHTHGQIYYYFFLWLAVMNLGSFSHFVLMRTFAHHGDIGVWIIVFLGLPMCYGLWLLFSKLLPLSYKRLELTDIQQIIVLVLVTLILFAAFGMAGFGNFSLYAIPIVILACWPTHTWVREASGKA